MGAPTLCTVDTADGATTAVLVGITPGVPPALARDRQHIAVSTADGVEVVDLDGRTQVTWDITAAALAWVGDSSSLIVQRGEEEGLAVVRLNIADPGAPPVAVVDPTRIEGRLGRGVSVSADGERLAFVVEHEGRWKLMVRELQSAEQVVLLESSEALLWPVWSPDGTKLALVVGDAIRTVDVRTGVDALLAAGPQPLTTPTWSPTGDRIAYVDARGALVAVSMRTQARMVIVDLTADPEARPFPALPCWS